MSLSTAPDNPSHRQKRGLNLYNVGSQTIPAHGVVEVVQSDRPEKTGPNTPLGGPTRFHVRRPTKDDQCGCIINGPCAIEPGQWGKIGWNDYPALALLSSAPTTIPETRGVKKDSFLLWPDYCGFLVWGDWDGIKAQVVRWDDCEDLKPVYVDECFYPGTMGQTAHVLKWDCHAFVDTGETVCVDDPNCMVMALPYSVSDKEVFWVKCARCDQSSETDCCCTPVARFGTERYVKIEDEISAESTGTGIILTGEACPPATETECELTVCNPSKRRVSCEEEAPEKMLARLLPGTCLWLLDVPRRAEWAVVTLLENVEPAEGGSALKEVEFLNWLDVSDWDKEPEFAKSYTVPGCANYTAIVRWEESSCQWVIMSVTPKKVPYLMTNLTYSNCNINRVAYTNAYLQFGDAACGQQATDTVIELTEENVVTGMAATCDASDSCGSLVQTKKNVCLFAPSGQASTPSTVMTWQEKDVVTDIQQNGLDVEGYMTTLCVPCFYDVGWEVVLEGTDCSSSSS